MPGCGWRSEARRLATHLGKCSGPCSSDRHNLVRRAHRFFAVLRGICFRALVTLRSSKLQAPSSKFQIPTASRRNLNFLPSPKPCQQAWPVVLVLGSWSFFGIWSLGFGACSRFPATHWKRRRTGSPAPSAGVPSTCRLGLDLGEPAAGRRIRDADEVLASWALNLSSGEMRPAAQWLIAVGTVELEFGCAHSLHPYHAQTGCQQYAKKSIYFLPADCACRSR